MLKRTPLYAAHCLADAKIVDFGGWEMPLHYGSQLEEHAAVRRDCGMFDVSHMQVIDVEGLEGLAYLRFALANNVDKLRQPGRALYSCLLNRSAGILDDLIVYRRDDSSYRMVVNASTAAKDFQWLTQLAKEFPSGLELLARPNLSIIAVQGPHARARVWQALPGTHSVSKELKSFQCAAVDGIMIACTGYTGEDGFELILPAERIEDVWAALLTQGVRPCGLAARDTLRLEAGMNLYGQDMNDSVSPIESGLAWTVDLTGSRDFIGRSALLEKAPVSELVGLVVTEKGGIPRAHYKVRTRSGYGEITSGTFSPTLRLPIGFARVPVGLAIGERVEIEIRDKRLAARLVKLPFVRHGQVLIDIKADGNG